MSDDRRPLGIRQRNSAGEDGIGHWAVFWEVAGLRELERSEWISVGRLTDIHGRRYRPPFVPEGPTLLGAAP